MLGLKIEVERLQVARRSHINRRFLACGKIGFKLRNNLFGDFTFDCEDIRQLPVVTFGPKVGICARIDQLCVDADPAFSALHAALQQMCHAKFVSDRAQVLLGAASVLHYGRAADYF